MPTLVVAYGIVIAGVFALYGLLITLGTGETMAGTISGMLLGSIPTVDRALKFLAVSRGGTPEIVPPDRFGLPLPLLISYGMPLAFVASQAGQTLARLAIGVTTPPGFIPDPELSQQLTRISLLLAIIVSSPLLYFAGRWLGRNAQQPRFLAILAISGLAGMVIHILDFIFLGDEAFINSYGASKSLPYFLLKSIGNGFNILIFAGLGFWHGSRQRPMAYLTHLVKKTPPDGQPELIRRLVDTAQTFQAVPPGPRPPAK